MTRSDPAVRGGQGETLSCGKLKALVVNLQWQKCFHPHLPVPTRQQGLSFCQLFLTEGKVRDALLAQTPWRPQPYLLIRPPEDLCSTGNVDFTRWGHPEWGGRREFNSAEGTAWEMFSQERRRLDKISSFQVWPRSPSCS